jgi:hypothetical protein
MKESYWGYWLILLSIFIVVVMLLTQEATTTNTEDYYQLKEVANSAVYDSIDYSYFRQTNQLRIIKELFVENFVRRFAQTVNMTRTYDISFYDIYELPPKVSIKIETETNNYMIANTQKDLKVTNSIDLIVEVGDLTSKINGTPENSFKCKYNT